jgi:hypothetical protein
MVSRAVLGSAESKAIDCHFFRRDELNVVQLRVANSAMNAVRLSVVHPHQVGLWLTEYHPLEQPCAG